MQLDNAIKTRKSVRRFLDKKPDWRKIIKAIDLARFAPRAGNIFPHKFILIKDRKKIKELEYACQQSFVGSVYYIVAVVSDDSKLKRSFGERGERYARQQAGAVIENFLLALNEQGLATCWVGHFYDDEVRRILEIPDDCIVEALFPIGKETKIKTAERMKPELENIIYFDFWKNKYMEPKTRINIESA